jgi:periplasmic divalent cation tolerance protein
MGDTNTTRSTQFIQVLTTVDSKDAAQRIARGLVEQQLAGCVQVIGPISSTYRWQGQIEIDEEWLCLIKTRAEMYGDVEATIRALHSYDEPEILAVPVTEGSEGYLHWLGEQVQSTDAAP